MARRTWAAGMAGVVLLTALSGCASQTERYCGELEDQKDALTDLAVRADRPQSEVLGETLDIWRGLREEAPGDLADEWTTLVFALEGLVEAFEEAGTTPEEFDPRNLPPGVSAEDARTLEAAASELASQRVTEAGDGVEQHARDVCGVDLGLSAQNG